MGGYLCYLIFGEMPTQGQLLSYSRYFGRNVNPRSTAALQKIYFYSYVNYAELVVQFFGYQTGFFALGIFGSNLPSALIC